jgi:hypothetical protein
MSGLIDFNGSWSPASSITDADRSQKKTIWRAFMFLLCLTDLFFCSRFALLLFLYSERSLDCIWKASFVRWLSSHVIIIDRPMCDKFRWFCWVLWSMVNLADSKWMTRELNSRCGYFFLQGLLILSHQRIHGLVLMPRMLRELITRQTRSVNVFNGCRANLRFSLICDFSINKSWSMMKHSLAS